MTNRAIRRTLRDYTQEGRSPVDSTFLTLKNEFNPLENNYKLRNVPESDSEDEYANPDDMGIQIVSNITYEDDTVHVSADLLKRVYLFNKEERSGDEFEENIDNNPGNSSVIDSPALLSIPENTIIPHPDLHYAVGERVYAYLEDYDVYRQAVILEIVFDLSLVYKNALTAFEFHCTRRIRRAFGLHENTRVGVESKSRSGDSTFKSNVKPRKLFYVNFQELNRRFDRWLWSDKISRENPVERRSENSSDEEKVGIMKEEYHDADDHEGMEPKEVDAWVTETKVKRNNIVFFGGYTMNVWYWSPFPDAFQNKEVIFICEFCMRYFSSVATYQSHVQRCTVSCPPGDEIYRDTQMSLSVFEVDGNINRIYCEDLCCMAKLFLDHKRFDVFVVSEFFFYIVCEWNGDTDSYHFRGYFSKDKTSSDRNLSCILSLPCFQNRGWGSFLIEFSYLLSKVSRIGGTPERPLSDLGEKAYNRYWTTELVKTLKVYRDEKRLVTIRELRDITMISEEDIIRTLNRLSMLSHSDREEIIILSDSLVQKYDFEASERHIRIQPRFLRWVPMVTTNVQLGT